MTSLAHHLDALPPGGAEFTTTQWSVVLAAQAGGSALAELALARLCQSYWYPLYAFIRRKGHEAHDAQDLTQEFFARLLEKNYLQSVNRQKGKFRSFLLAALEHFLNNEWDRRHRLKRGGGCHFISWEEMIAEERYGGEPAHEWTAERLFDRRWALTILERALQQLQREYASTGRADLFSALQGYLSGDRNDETPYAATAATLNMSAGTLKVAVHRLRQRYAEMVRAEVARTLAPSEDIEEEIRHLFAAVG